SASLPNYEQASFDAYLAETRSWLAANRAYLTEDKQAEVDANAPFELAPSGADTPRKGVLLVHGLGDSPFYLRDLSQVLADRGFLVRSLLLPGHGSRPADLTLPDYDDWTRLVSNHVALLKARVQDVWLGGFSTGSNLVTAYAARDDDIQGLLLFSPALVPRDALYVLAPVANRFIDWLDFDPHEGNYTRYSTLAMNGAALLSQSVREVDALFKEKPYDKPTLIVISERDSVINSAGVLERFQAQFTHANSRLIWYGEKPVDDPRVHAYPASLPAHRISSFSHMSVLFAPSNSYYGKNGSQLICDNGQTEDAEAQCPTLTHRWYASFDYREDGKVHARLTWNPHFADMAETIDQLVN
ncbi:MAG: alpha/beta fold hydrolase, partial [Pseudomonadota bacterium]